jgi:hypothetical protein
VLTNIEIDEVMATTRMRQAAPTDVAGRPS